MALIFQNLGSLFPFLVNLRLSTQHDYGYLLERRDADNLINDYPESAVLVNLYFFFLIDL